MESWILTDDAQYTRKISNTVYEFLQLNQIPKKGNRDIFRIFHGVVYTNDTDEYPEEKVEGVLRMYGYDGRTEVENIYGVAANQIIAECLFETHLYGFETLYEGNMEDAEIFMRDYIKEY